MSNIEERYAKLVARWVWVGLNWAFIAFLLISAYGCSSYRLAPHEDFRSPDHNQDRPNGADARRGLAFEDSDESGECGCDEEI